MVVIPTKKASAGRVLIKPRGEWDANVTYEMLDLVNHNGYAFLAKRTVIGIEPSDDYSTYWHNLLDIRTIIENNIAETVSDEVGDILEARFENRLSEARYVSDLMIDCTNATFVQWDAETENTPYKAGLTECTEGFARVFGSVSGNHTIVAWTNGEENYNYFTHYISNGEDKGWDSLQSRLNKYVEKSGDSMTGPLTLGGDKGKVYADSDGTFLEAKKDSINNRKLKIANPMSNNSLINALLFSATVEGENKEYNLAGEHNFSALGIARLEVKTYKGTGKSGSENKNSITFSRQPKLIVLSSPNCGYVHVFPYGQKVITWCPYDDNSSAKNEGYQINLNYDGSTMSWYGEYLSSLNDESLAYVQYNEDGKDYVVIGIA